ncbi:MAG: cytochrome c oxidase accessory protein FixG [Myxococcota bacterium]
MDGRPAILFNIADRRFYLFGTTANAQDFYLAFFLLSGIGFLLIVVAALWGRVWCGWACPQTVFLDGVFRRIERWIEGPAARRRRLAAGPWTPEKVLKKGLKHTIYVILAGLIAHIFLAYFISTDALGAMITEGPGAHSTTFTWALVLTIVIYLNFWWFREQLCIVICPYGRLQSVLQDRDTINVQYDHKRGEPRGKVSNADAGDCIDCGRCVAVCPTGIDIRQGHQLECIGCAYCIDACDTVMAKVDRPFGLIRYDSERGIETGKRRFWRGRVFFYIAAGIVGLAFGLYLVLNSTSVEVNFLRRGGSPYVLTETEVQSSTQLHLTNKRPGDITFVIRALPPYDRYIKVGQPEVSLKTFADHTVPIIVRVPRAEYKPGMSVDIEVTQLGTEEPPIIKPMKILGPPNRLRPVETTP